MAFLEAAIGVVGGFLNRPPKPPENQFLKALAQVMKRGTDLYDQTDFSALVDRYIADTQGFVQGNADRALRNLGAQRAGIGQDPTMFSTERSVAEGVALRDTLTQAGMEAAAMRAGIPMQRMAMLGAIGQMGAAGAGPENDQNSMNFQNAINNWQGTNQMVGALASSIPDKKRTQSAGKGAPKTRMNSYWKSQQSTSDDRPR